MTWDWPSFALVTYAFLLALLLAVIILRSIRDTKGRYQKVLEEKELKLAASQLELEETMEALQQQAAALELEWNGALKKDKDSALAAQQRLLEMQGAVVALQSRLSRLEQAKAQAVAGHGREEIERPEAAGALLKQPSMEVPQEEPGGDGTEASGRAFAPLLEEEGEAAQGQDTPQENDLQRRRMLSLLQSGMSVAQISRELRCSWTEATLLVTQWNKGFLKQDLDGGSGS